MEHHLQSGVWMMTPHPTINLPHKPLPDSITNNVALKVFFLQRAAENQIWPIGTFVHRASRCNSSKDSSTHLGNWVYCWPDSEGLLSCKHSSGLVTNKGGIKKWVCGGGFSWSEVLVSYSFWVLFSCLRRRTYHSGTSHLVLDFRGRKNPIRKENLYWERSYHRLQYTRVHVPKKLT